MIALHPRLRPSIQLRLAAAGLACVLVSACSGGDGEVYEITSSIEGASFTPVAPARSAEPVEPGELVEAVDAEPTTPTAQVAAADPAPTHNPNDGVQAQRPANLPEDVRYLAFDDVSWPEYEPLDLRDIDAEAYGTSEFPADIAELDGARVAFDGYMVPVDFEDRRVTSFILSRYLPGCCFGVMPRMDEWIEIDVLSEGGVEYFPYQIVRVTGTFEVGELLDDYGYVRSIYRIEADEVDAQL